VHGDDGLDEISLSGETLVAEVGAPNQSAVARGNKNLEVRTLRLAPENFGLERVPLSALVGGGPAENAVIIRAIFDGELGPRRDIVVMNAAAAIFVAGRAANLREGSELAAASIDSGAAGEKLEALIEFTNR
jgi:anthranilate phosphoribosyltransferase